MPNDIEEFVKKLGFFKAKLRRLPNFMLSTEDLKFLNSKLRVVIVGEVGVGKSSVLERLIGKDELKFAKGPDCVTRRPVIIKFTCTGNSCSSSFKKGKGSVEENKLLISKESVQLITETPIIINLNVTVDEMGAMMDETVELEFVDLPGLTSLARPDQPQDYPEHTRKLINSYLNRNMNRNVNLNRNVTLESELKVIDLFVLGLPTDADFTNSETLRLVKELKINDRVILFLSKLDLSENLSGSNNCFDFINEVTEGFVSVVAVRNAPQLETSHSLSALQLREDLFFSNYHKFSLINNFGISRLREDILGFLEAQIALHRNRIISRLEGEKLVLKGRLDKFMNPNLQLNLITEYIDRVKSELASNETIDKDTGESSTSVGGRIGMIFGKMVPEALESIDPFQGIDLKNIEILIKNCQGLKSNFHLEGAFKVLVKNQLRLSESVITDCLNMVTGEMRTCLQVPIQNSNTQRNFSFSLCDDDEFYDALSISDFGEFDEDQQYQQQQQQQQSNYSTSDPNSFFSQLSLIPNLSKLINRKTSNLIEKNYTKTRKYLDEFVEMERETIFTKEREFLEAIQEFYLSDFRKYKNQMMIMMSRSGGGGGVNGNGNDNTFSDSNAEMSNFSYSGDLSLGYRRSRMCSSIDLETKNYSKTNATAAIINTNADTNININVNQDELPLNIIHTNNNNNNYYYNNNNNNISSSNKNNNFFHEFLALIFPSGNLNLKRVEYRPKHKLRALELKQRNLTDNNDKNNNENEQSINVPIPIIDPYDTQHQSIRNKDCDFLLKLLEIYLKIHHRRLIDFLPKCLNRLLIGSTLKDLPLVLLPLPGDSGTGNDFNLKAELRRIEKLIEIIEEVCLINYNF